MSTPARTAARLAAPLLLALASLTAQAGEGPGYENGGDAAPGAVAMILDLAVARPLGIGATVLGTAVFIVGLPFELLAGNVSDPARKLVIEPAQFTFTRPLGEEIN